MKNLIISTLCGLTFFLSIALLGYLFDVVGIYNHWWGLSVALFVGTLGLIGACMAFEYALRHFDKEYKK